MNKDLEVIQKISQVAKTVCRILFVVSIVGAAIALAAAISVAVMGTGELFSIGKITVYGLVTDDSMPAPQLVAAMIAFVIMLIPAAILMKTAENYFAQELKDGTPFTAEGAERIKKLGIMTMIMPFAAEIIVQTMVKIVADTTDAEITSGGSIITGLLLIFLHFVFKYGAEIAAQNKAEAAAVSAPAADESKEG